MKTELQLFLTAHQNVGQGRTSSKAQGRPGRLGHLPATTAGRTGTRCCCSLNRLSEFWSSAARTCCGKGETRGAQTLLKAPAWPLRYLCRGAATQKISEGLVSDQGQSSPEQAFFEVKKASSAPFEDGVYLLHCWPEG